ncbi:pregnancy-induced growth inhibitor [Aphelenchoides avenae]|nr:pregnancy-induced growth inhibitor [Aphelenchus avenae]
MESSSTCDGVSKLRLDTEVVVVGNGPAGLSLSTFLHGWHPYYDKEHRHPNPVIDKHLIRSSDGGDHSLLDQDLAWYAEECAEQLNSSVGAYPHLYDTLVRPDPFLEHSQRASVRYAYHPERYVPHLVIGDGPIGGSWNTYDPAMVAVSLSHWMDLPGFSIAQFLGGEPLVKRLPSMVLCGYMKAYSVAMGIRKHIWTRTTVTRITKLCHDATGEEYWEVSGMRHGKCPFVIKCRKVVLACGRSRPRMLEVDGEMAEPNVVYDVASLKSRIAQEQAEASDQYKEASQPVVVVGDGISAADAVNVCLSNDIPVVHVFRRAEKELRGIMMSRLSATIYPEYAKVFQYMTGKDGHPNYVRMPSTYVKAIEGSTAVLEAPTGDVWEPFRTLVVCVGLQSSLPLLDDKHEFQSDYRSASDPSLFAVGSLGGDHFVRYLIGGCLQVAQTLVRDYESYQHQQCKLDADSSVICQTESCNFGFLSLVR